MSTTATKELFAEWFAERSLDEELFPGFTVRAYQQLLTPPPAPPGSRWRAEVAYEQPHRRSRGLVLDLYAGAPGERRPGIVFIHGGGWKGGHRYMLVRQAGEMAAKGYVTATIDYRLSGEARWPAALEDAKCAVRWMRTHANDIGMDPKRIAVAGGSAGGHLAALVALTPGRYEGTGGWDAVSSAAQAAVLYEPALDLRDPAVTDELRSAVDEFLAGADGAASDASPITHITRTCPPLLTRVGDADPITPAEPCRTFHRLLDEASVPNRLDILPGQRHGLPVRHHAECVHALTEFLCDYLPAG